MLSETRIYLDLSNDIEQLLDNNQISIEDILRHADIDANVIYDIPPCQTETEAGTKNLRPIIVSAAFSITALSVSTAISQVLNTLYDQPHFVEIQEIHEFRDANGELVLDENGQPVVRFIKRNELIEPRAEDRSTELESSSDGNAFRVKVTLQDKQISE